jgi:hypothetical protein
MKMAEEADDYLPTRGQLGGIIEGPSKWSIRPVAEFFDENELANRKQYPV